MASPKHDELTMDIDIEYVNADLLQDIFLREEEQALPAFYSALEAQLLRVHRCMELHQRLIGNAIEWLDIFASGVSQAPAAARPPPSLRDLSGHLRRLIDFITRFQDMAVLNHKATRRIVGDFNRRFQVDFAERVGLPGAAQLLAAGREVRMWLLDPAKRLLASLHAGAEATVAADPPSPSRQWDYWKSELKAGAMLLRLRLSQGQLSDTTSLRLQLLITRGYASLGLHTEAAMPCIRNTFVHCSVQDGQSLRRAASETPPAAARNAEVRCRDAGKAAMSPVTAVARSETVAVSERAAAKAARLPLQTRRLTPGSGKMASQCGGKPARHVEHEQEVPAVLTTPERSGVACGGGANRSAFRCQGASQLSLQNAPGAVDASLSCHVSPSSRGPRWWTELPDTCPISGFPVNLLPYPPFKLQEPWLQAQTGGPKSQKTASWLVDGPYLVMQVLRNWRFEVLGVPLTASQISAVDAHIKRCKLGPFRLSRALELFNEGSPSSKKELDTMRAKAARRLEMLRNVQRSRLQRLSGGGEGA